VETIGSRFGALLHGLLMPRLPMVTPALLLQVLPAALSFTLLGGVESLQSARVADTMTGRKHRSNMELVPAALKRDRRLTPQLHGFAGSGAG
jgi:SulP family sulfate permease